MPSSGASSLDESAARYGVGGVALAGLGVLCVLQVAAAVLNVRFRKQLKGFLAASDDTNAGTMRELSVVESFKCSVAWRKLHYYMPVDTRLQDVAKKGAAEKSKVSPLLGERKAANLQKLGVTPTFHVSHQAVRMSKPAAGFDIDGHKQLLHNATGYINPGELIAIMGPSGCGKTTLLECISGRRRAGVLAGARYVNGVPYESGDAKAAGELRKPNDDNEFGQMWLVENSGYVRQLSAPYVDNLTVLENLSYSAAIRIPDVDTKGNAVSNDQRFRRAKQAMHLADLHRRADTVVEVAGGGGLSGGQKRRLAVAIELVADPYMLFMDEPTSGLDGASSLGMLTMLRKVCDSHLKGCGLTIHQPRIEIFNMFDNLCLMVNGATTFFGRPVEAIKVFSQCAIDVQLMAFDADNSGDVTAEEIDALLDSTNPADLVSDVLLAAKDDQLCFSYLTEYYDRTTRPAIDGAIAEAAPMAPTKPGKERPQSSALQNIFMLEARFLSDSSFVTLTVPIVISLLSAVLFGTLFRDDEPSGQILAAATYKSMLAAPLYAPVVASSISRMLHVIEIETEIGVVDWWHYVASIVAHFTVFAGFSAMAMYLVIYALTFQDFDADAFLTGCLFTWVFNLCHMGLSLMICFAVTSVLGLDSAIAVWAVGVTESIMQIFCGFFKPYNIANVVYQVVYCMNPEFWFFSAMVPINLKGQTRDCPADPGSPLDDPKTKLPDGSRNFVFLANTTAVNELIVEYEQKTSAAYNCLAQSPESFVDLYGYRNIVVYFHLLVLLGMTMLFMGTAVVIAIRPWRPKGIQGRERSLFPGAAKLDAALEEAKANVGGKKLSLYLPNVEEPKRNIRDAGEDVKTMSAISDALGGLSDEALAKEREMSALKEWKEEKALLHKTIDGEGGKQHADILARAQAAAEEAAEEAAAEAAEEQAAAPKGASNRVAAGGAMFEV